MFCHKSFSIIFIFAILTPLKPDRIGGWRWLRRERWRRELSPRGRRFPRRSFANSAMRSAVNISRFRSISRRPSPNLTTFAGISITRASRSSSKTGTGTSSFTPRVARSTRTSAAKTTRYARRSAAIIRTKRANTTAPRSSTSISRRPSRSKSTPSRSSVRAKTRDNVAATRVGVLIYGRIFSLFKKSWNNDATNASFLANTMAYSLGKRGVFFYLRIMNISKSNAWRGRWLVLRRHSLWGTKIFSKIFWEGWNILRRNYL